MIVSDSFGRAWRQGTTDVAIGVAGLGPLLDLRGKRDRVGYELHATTIAVADEIAGAAELVMGKTDGIPAALVRGLDVRGEGSRATSSCRPSEISSASGGAARSRSGSRARSGRRRAR